MNPDNNLTRQSVLQDIGFLVPGRVLNEELLLSFQYFDWRSYHCTVNEIIKNIYSKNYSWRKVKRKHAIVILAG